MTTPTSTAKGWAFRLTCQCFDGFVRTERFSPYRRDYYLGFVLDIPRPRPCRSARSDTAPYSEYDMPFGAWTNVLFVLRQMPDLREK